MAMNLRDHWGTAMVIGDQLVTYKNQHAYFSILTFEEWLKQEPEFIYANYARWEDRVDFQTYSSIRQAVYYYGCMSFGKAFPIICKCHELSLFYAVLWARTNLVRLLVESCEVPIKCACYPVSLLSIAAKQCEFEIVKLIVEAAERTLKVTN